MDTQPPAQVIAAALCIACLSLTPAARAEGEQDSQSVAFYVLGLAIDGSVGVGEAAAEIDLSASEFFDELEWGGMGSYRYQLERWSFQVDVVYATLSGQTAAGPRAQLDLSMIELDGGYRVSDAFEIVVGARGWQYDAMVDAPQSGGRPIEGDRRWTDPLIGVRFTLPIGERWELLARGDVGGFGVGSEFAWHATVAATWRLLDNFGVLFGYRVFDVELDNDDAAAEVHADLQHSGPALGFSLAF